MFAKFVNILRIAIVLLFLSTSMDCMSGENFNLNKSTGSVFIENKGQWPDEVQFLARMNGMDAWVTKSGITYDVYSSKLIDALPDKTFSKQLNISNIQRTGHVFKAEYNSDNDIHAEGNGRQNAYYNYFLGKDKSAWASEVTLFSEIKVNNIYEGIDARYYFDNSSIRYDFIIAANANPNDISLNYIGQEALSLNDKGELIVETSLGTICNNNIYAYQNIDGEKVEIECKFVFSNSGEVSFKLGNYDKSKELIIDPLVYSSYIGATSDDDIPMGLEVDANGYAYITGHTSSAVFPVTTGAYQTTLEGNDVYICKLNPDRTLAANEQLIFSTFYGAERNDQGCDLVLDDAGNIYVTGTTDSYDFPVIAGGAGNPYDKTGGINDIDLNKYLDIFIGKFNNSGTSLEYSTYIGGGRYEIGYCIALDSEGKVYVAGYTSSEDIKTKTPIAYAAKYKARAEAYVAKLSLDGNGSADMIYSTYLGGDEDEEIHGMVIDANKNVLLSGFTSSQNFPTTDGSEGPPSRLSQGIFVAKMNLDEVQAASLVYSSVFAIEGEKSIADMTADDDQNLYITGATSYQDFPVTAGVYDNSHNGGQDIFLCKYYIDETDGPGIKYSTFIGGEGNDVPFGIYRDADDGSIYITGMSTSIDDYPTTATAFQTINRGDDDLIISKFNPAGNGSSDLLYSSLIGGMKSDRGINIAVAPNKKAYIVGITDSSAFRTTRGSFATEGSPDSYNSFLLVLDVINSPLNFELNDLETCEGVPVAIGIKSDIDGGSGTGEFTYEWVPSDGLDNATIANPTVLNPTETKEYSVLVIETDGTNPTGIIAEETMILTVLDKPEAVIDGGYETEVCAGTGETMLYSTTEEDGVLIEWVIENGSPVEDPPYSNSNIEVKWNNAGDGKVMLIKTNDVTLCEDTTEAVITVHPSPDADISGDNEVCNGCTNTYFTTLETGETAEWSITNGTANGATDEEEFDVTWSDTETSGEIQLIKTNEFGCTDTTKLLITITETPRHSISGDDVVCENEIITYTTSDREGAVNEWSVTGGEAVDPAPHDGLTFRVIWNEHPGTVTLRQVIESKTYDETVSKPIVVRPAPTPDISGTTTAEPTDVETYSVDTPQASSSYDWDIEPDNMGNISGSGTSIDIEWLSPGTVSVLLTETNENGCIGYDTLTVTIGSSNSGINGEMEVCEESTHSYSTQNIPNTTLAWSVTGGSIDGDNTAIAVDVTWGSAGNGTLSLERTYTSSQTTETTDTTVTIHPLPDKPVITRTGAQFENLSSSSADNNQWYKDGVEITGETGQIYTPDPDETAVYTVVVTNEYGCSNTSNAFTFGPTNTSAELTIRANPEKAVSGAKVNIEIVINNPVELDDENGANSVTAEIRMKGNILIPDNSAQRGSFQGHMRNIPVTINLPDNAQSGDVLLTIPCVAVLDSSISTNIEILNIAAVDGIINVTSTDGQFALDGICYQGGSPRLLRSGNLNLGQIKPNPAGKTCKIEYEILAEEMHSLYILDINGRKVMTIFESQTGIGKHEQEIDISELSSGVYFLVLESLTDRKTVIMNVAQ